MLTPNGRVIWEMSMMEVDPNTTLAVRADGLFTIKTRPSGGILFFFENLPFINPNWPKWTVCHMEFWNCKLELGGSWTTHLKNIISSN